MVKNKNVIITGAFQGIGNASVKIFAEGGANVFACSIPINDDARTKFENFCKELELNNKVFVKPVYFDMGDDEQIKSAVKQIQSHKVQIDGLINIAGINRDAYFGMITEKDLEDTFKVNVFSQIVFTQYIVRLIGRTNNPASIVFTSSIAAINGTEGQVAYGASKAALIGAMKSMAKELGPKKIRVNCVAPGVIKSPMTEKLDVKVLDKSINCMDIPHIGEPVDVSNLYMYLVSDLSSHITGQTIRIDGGI